MRAYDFVIVGAGSAGCVMASRLSADPSVRVLLLEAGGSDRDPFIHMPGGIQVLTQSGRYDWGYESVPQRHLDGRRIFTPRGRVLGGSSSTNGMVAVRGAPEDYASWGKHGAAGWSFEDVLPYYKRLETYIPGHSEYHGADGPIRISRLAPRGPLMDAWLKAGQEAGFPYNDDVNGAAIEGVGPYDRNVYKGRRQSAAVCYLRPALSRPNLHVVTRARLTRMIVRNGRATGVEYVDRRGVQTAQGGEVILSGGAINSPQALMLSGIGEADGLRRIGIEPVLELKGVGRNLHDHLVVSTSVKTQDGISFVKYRRPQQMALAGLQYMLFRKGVASEPGPAMAGFLKTDPSLAMPDVQYHFVPLLYSDGGRKLGKGHGFMAISNVCRPRSRGTVALRSNDPFAPPLIDPNYLSDPYDLATMVAGVRLARRIFGQDAFAPYREVEIKPGEAVQSQSALEDYVRANGESIHHHVGTCRMGMDDGSVVDAQLRVHGISGLRVIDASIIPEIISGNTNLCAMMIAEKAADLVLGNTSPTA